MNNKQYYRLELDDVATPSFVSLENTIGAQWTKYADLSMRLKTQIM